MKDINSQFLLTQSKTVEELVLKIPTIKIFAHNGGWDYRAVRWRWRNEKQMLSTIKIGGKKLFTKIEKENIDIYVWEKWKLIYPNHKKSNKSCDNFVKSEGP